ncbi:hypothetical protein PhCBS80983_g01384 [Powellomyces hirtus]|uniref:Nudix hydrolase domain-containing protein n=1 Tax=Powellomyces hirtus TaxID=109895 RepID=A0A507ECN0_9FUNG|nr:hypothetical protein PhCBS80983_g01384 [Powellomyces hirtus]
MPPHTPQPPAGILSAANVPAALTCVPTVSFSPLPSPKWLQLVEASFPDPSGTWRTWELVQRTHQKEKAIQSPDDVDAVDVVAIIRASTSPHQFPPVPTILVVLQFRPPTQKWTLEFPSGLVDAGESPELAAGRELKEETGYCGTIQSVGPPITYEPGITSSCSRMVTVDIDPDSDVNRAPQPAREDDEWSLRTVAMPLLGLLDTLHDLQTQCAGLRIDSRLYSFACGMSLRT